MRNNNEVIGNKLAHESADNNSSMLQRLIDYYWCKMNELLKDKYFNDNDRMEKANKLIDEMRTQRMTFDEIVQKYDLKEIKVDKKE
ncbi:MAG: hypothetical protein WC570_03240 [Patescibacteria group bacterium]